MDQNTPAEFSHGSSNFHTYYSQTKKGGGGVIDLGLSLRTIQHETYLPSTPMIGLDGYGELIDWSQRPYTQLKSEEPVDQRLAQRYYNDGEEGRGKLAYYVKVNMDGSVVGRKVCILNQGTYSTLALQLDNMFGMQTVSGLKLFQDESEFSLVYRDREGIWRNVGDVPWKEFVASVNRMRIARRDDALLPY
ncbi:hypothetical protein BRARA_F03499 [Brassica rapa]|uniref:Auxin-responsive protein n=1 Tax=Brassica campestris TaxID=3711 RepID=A0A397Z446_BRACM|nr:auxin-responsive protein IAA32-like [Brassica napus]RID60335.1 hypothetical protein BRARA_F03499 [Brassica rapa]VDC68791.1 unnamed protein product [Brassica rapa]